MSCLAFSEQKPFEKLPEIKPDSLKSKLPELNSLNKIDFKKPVAANDSFLYKILNKKPENPELYSILVKKPETDKIIQIPNSSKTRGKIAFPELKKRPELKKKK